MLDMVKELAKLILSHLDKFLGNYRTKQFEDHNSFETKVTYFDFLIFLESSQSCGAKGDKNRPDQDR